MATPIPANDVRLDARFVAEATAGRIARLRGQAPALARGITSDSRTTKQGSAFVALRGEEYDGHAFVSAAIEAGAVLVVVERDRWAASASSDVVEVDDTRAAWGAMAHAHVKAWRAASEFRRVLAISGSAGKTTTKEICASLLRTRGECHATSGNLNNLVGVPAVLFGLEPRHRFAVVEMGMSVRGEIAALGAMSEPDVALVTNVGLAHAGGVGGTLDDVAREKGDLFVSLRPTGTAIVNADDALVVARAARVPHVRRVTFGRHPRADVRLVSRETAGIGTSHLVVERAGRTATFEIPIAGEAAALDFVAAVAAAESAAGPLDDTSVASALGTLAPIPGRMRVFRAGAIVVLDDAYNANPASMRAALATLSEMGSAKALMAGEASAPVHRRVAVLGEMKELGPAADEEHTAIGEVVADAGVALLVSCGGLAEGIARAAEQRGVEVVRAQKMQCKPRLRLSKNGCVPETPFS